MSDIEHSGADVLLTHLINVGVATLPSLVQPWPGTVGIMPTSPDEALTVYDTNGRMDGRYLGSGKTIDHPAFQIRFRSRTARSANKRILKVQGKLDLVKRSLVTIEGKQYRIQAVRRSTTIFSLGPEEGNPQRYLFTINGFITYSLVE